MQFTYKTQGVCSREIYFELEDDVVKNITFLGGCDGNLKGIARLVEGRNVNEVLPLLEGITCGYKTTSCPDQLACALKQAIKQEKTA